ncbi:MAG: membrane protein insertion efficiency factor YidD [Bacteroidota bacterium]|nr:membrane protein insertion efficiency factor YidD [Bacteroidota bacterium]
MRNHLIDLFLGLIIFCVSGYVCGQDITNENINRLLTVKKYADDHSHIDTTINSKSKDYYLFYRFYKSAFSAQDVPNTCGFYPSCSTYGLLAIKKWGLFRGTLATFDRLLRCNNFHYSGQYIFDEKRSKYLDLVDNE